MERLEKIFFYLLWFFLPSQLGRHFWPNFSHVLGLRVDYLSPTIYLTDIFIFCLFFFWLKKKIFSQKMTPKFPPTPKINGWFLVLFPFLIFLLWGIFQAKNPAVGVLKLVKLGELFLFGIYLRQTIKNLSQVKLIVHLLSLGIIFEAFLAWAQFFKQGSVGGIFWWFGERTFSGGTPGIAQATLEGRLILRPYGTFPHPNVLAGFLGVTFPLIIFFGAKNFWEKILKSLSLGLGITTLFLTFSRTGWLTGLFTLTAATFFTLKKKFFVFLIWGILLFLIFWPIIFSRFTALTTTDFETWQKREELSEIAWTMTKTSPLFGVGLNNFLVRLPEFSSPGQIRFFQPAHNLYLLIASELGLVGLGLFLGFLFLTYQRLFKEKLFNHLSLPRFLMISLSAILILGFFDHYFYTLQQGQLLATLIFALSWSSGIDQKEGFDK